MCVNPQVKLVILIINSTCVWICLCGIYYSFSIINDLLFLYLYMYQQSQKLLYKSTEIKKTIV